MHRTFAVLFCALAFGTLAPVVLSQTAPAPEKQFLYKLQPSRPEMLKSGPTKEEGAIIDEHFKRLKELTRSGTVILAGRTLNTDETSFGIVIFRAPSEDAAREIMNNDPAVKQGVMKATLFPYRVALMEGKPVP
jgi:uncharacterized protein YciI